MVNTAFALDRKKITVVQPNFMKQWHRERLNETSNVECYSYPWLCHQKRETKKHEREKCKYDLILYKYCHDEIWLCTQF